MANLGWKSPFEVLYGSAPNLEDLRALGCLYYAINIGETDKFEARAHKCVLLGYTFGFKGINCMIFSPPRSSIVEM